MKHPARTPFVCAFCRSQPHSKSRLAPIPLPSTFTRRYNRPSFAPKPTLDIKHIARNPGLYEQNCIDRNYPRRARDSWRILELVEQRRASQNTVVRDRQRNNEIQQELKALSAGSGAVDEKESQEGARRKLIEEAQELKAKLSAVDEEDATREHTIQELALGLPNLSSSFTPNGDEPVVLEHVAGSREGNVAATTPSHADIGADLGILDFAGAASTTGWGWYFLDGAAADLEDALVQYALSVAKRRGWTRASPPSMVYAHIADACGFQPRDQHDEQQIYSVLQSDATKPMLSLAATAEIPLAGRFAGHVFEEHELPLKTMGTSRCYRAEAGARGVDTKGLYRVHEFTKVEMFAWTLPDGSAGQSNFSIADEPSSCIPVFEEMVAIQKEILQSLGLEFRVLEMPAADLGASASRKIDMEVLFPSRRATRDHGWGEVTSVSICTDYQSRRLAARVRRKADRSLAWPFTVNGTALAVPRVLAAVLENGWNERDRSVTIPEVLRPWMSGFDCIKRAS